MHSLLERMQRELAAALLDAQAAPDAPSADDGVGAGLAQYRAQLVANWEKALAHAYPVVRALVGAEFFAALAASYGRAWPSTSGDLNHYGAQFASFVSAFEHTQSLPYLADLAALEWHVHEARAAADAAPLRRERLAMMTPDELLAARFDVHPACAWLQSPFPVASIWQAHQSETNVPLPETLDQGEFALIVRPRWAPRVLVSRAGEIAALQALRAGEDIDGAIAAGVRADRDFDFARAIVRWLDHTVLIEPA